MGKILALIIIAALIFWIFKNYRIKESKTADTSTSSEDMVSCAYCGIHIPKKESLSNQNNQYFCCNQHYEEYKEL